MSVIQQRDELRDLLVSMLGREEVVLEKSRAFCAIGIVETVDPKAEISLDFRS